MTRLFNNDGFNLETNGDPIALPVLLDGGLLELLNKEYSDFVTNRFGFNRYLISDPEKFYGFNLFKTLIFDDILKSRGARTSLPENFDDDLIAISRNKYSLHSRAVILKDSNQGDYRDLLIASNLSEYISDNARAVLISGLRVEPETKCKKGYGLTLVPIKEELQVICDDRLLKKWDRYWFTKTDSKGLPIDLRQKRISEKDRQWHVPSLRISGFGLNYDAALGSVWDSAPLFYTHPRIRINLVST